MLIRQCVQMSVPYSIGLGAGAHAAAAAATATTATTRARSGARMAELSDRDLAGCCRFGPVTRPGAPVEPEADHAQEQRCHHQHPARARPGVCAEVEQLLAPDEQIGRASCRGRVSKAGRDGTTSKEA